MDKEYNFDWFIQEIDSLLILKLTDGKKAIGIYQAREILSIDLDEVSVKFANTLDLTNFISHSVIRFSHVSDMKSIIDIPIRNIETLFLNSNELGVSIDKSMKLADLGAFAVKNDEILNDDYLIYAYKINNPSEELQEMLKIAHDFGNMGMQDKFLALEKVNLINYHKVKDSSERRI